MQDMVTIKIVIYGRDIEDFENITDNIALDTSLSLGQSMGTAFGHNSLHLEIYYQVVKKL